MKNHSGLALRTSLEHDYTKGNKMQHKFFDNSEPMLKVEYFYHTSEKVSDIGIITFSEKVIEWVLRNYKCEKVGEICCANGARAIYSASVNGCKVAFYMSMIGSAVAGSCIEDFAYLTGATKFIMFGSCGTLQSTKTEGKIIVPQCAYRDEGLSYHYLELENEYLDMPGWKKVENFFNDKKVSNIVGKTWTTDAIFRETKEKAERLRQEGCIAVEMECAGVQAVCQSKGFELYDFLFASDHLEEGEWKNHLLGTSEEYDMQIMCMKFALELAVFLSGI